jgi:hypothetical protein
MVLEGGMILSLRSRLLAKVCKPLAPLILKGLAIVSSPFFLYNEKVEQAFSADPVGFTQGA